MEVNMFVLRLTWLYVIWLAPLFKGEVPPFAAAYASIDLLG